MKIYTKKKKKNQICYIGYVKIKDLKYVKTYSVNSLHLIFNIVNGYVEEINGNKYLILVPTNDYDYDKKYMKIKLNSDNKLPLNKTIESLAIAVRAIFYENNKNYIQVFLDQFLHKI